MLQHAASEAKRSDVPRGKIRLDLSGDPIREMLLVAVLSEMIRAATSENPDVLTGCDQDPTTHDPEHGPRQAEAASHS